MTARLASQHRRHRRPWRGGSAAPRTSLGLGPRSRWLLGAWCSLALAPVEARAEGPAPRSPAEATLTRDAFSLEARSETQLRLFQRALLPGPGGALVTTDTQLPVLERVEVRARDLDTRLGADATDVELAAWGMGTGGDVGPERRLDGDVVTAKVTQRLGPAALSAGRQSAAGGAARWVRFDGLRLGARSPTGFSVDAYGGWTVLPRWNARPSVLYLGGNDSLLRDPQALPQPARSGYWLAGGRAAYTHPKLGELGLSIHEEHHGGGLGRRSAALDLALQPAQSVELDGQTLLDLDGGGIADARWTASYFPTDALSVDLEVLRTNPTLFLSKDSVLSVFGSERFDELGTALDWRALPELRVGGAAFLQHYSGGDGGARAELRLRGEPLQSGAVVAQLVYQRLQASNGGYHALRSSLRYRIAAPLWATGEHYAYLYDVAIRGVPISSVEAFNLSWQAAPHLGLLLGSSITVSPYAAADAQVMLRLRYALDTTLRLDP